VTRRTFLQATVAVSPAAVLAQISREASDAKREWHRGQASRPLREKVALLLELQRQDLPLISKRRALRPWEKPWPIDP